MGLEGRTPRFITLSNLYDVCVAMECSPSVVRRRATRECNSMVCGSKHPGLAQYHDSTLSSLAVNAENDGRTFRRHVR